MATGQAVRLLARWPKVSRPDAADAPDLDMEGRPNELNRKRAKNAAGEMVEYLAADSLQSYIKGLYRAAGLFEASSHSGRRTFASRLLAAGQSLDDVQALLGHADLDHVAPYLAVDEEILAEMFEVVL